MAIFGIFFCRSSSSNTTEQPVTNDFDSQSESSTDDDISAEDYSTSDEQKEEEGSTSIEEDDNESETSNYQSSSDEDEISLSSNEDQIYKITRNNVLTDPTLVKIRLLIKRVRELVGLVHQSSNLNEYVRQQKKEKGLDSDGLILDCDIRWNSCYMMIDRFITYQPIIESITILHRNIISGLSSPVVQHLKRMIFTEDEWDHLIATKNVLKIIYKAYKLLAGRRYQTLSIAYMVTRGLRNSLLKTSSSPQVYIENIIKKYLLHAFEYHFDQKLSVDQKQAMLIAAYLDPYTYRRMPDSDKNIAEKLIVDKLNENTSGEQNLHDSLTNPVQQGSIDPLDDFLMECG
ncbi:unnamed protein product [Rotaria sordida]|uniref:Uncharacterized protein n=1 Tax=Rotaria sordida TaxID=392033 RepID=A0A819FQU5_9BILA|nr:unnamed protein product [Rotaria sordida]CAF3873313.1 unnamed protein product [Rotaria sordida]